MKIAGAAVAIVIVIALIYHFATATAPAITVQTTIITTNFNVNSCETITLPGTYHITDNITTTSTSGACIRVASGNVKLEGNGHGIVGSGPFTISGTRSYGVLVDSGSWAIISNLTIAKFSYGVFINGSNNNQVNNVTVRNSTLSGIYLHDSSNNQFNGDRIMSTIANGGLNITLGSNNTVSKSSIEYNLGLGMSLSNSTKNRINGSAFIGNPTDLACYGTSVFSSSNKFQQSSCFENSKCNFAYCSGQNNQSLITRIALQTPVSSCGSINRGGSYYLSNNLNLSNYMNISLPQGADSACITINSSDVHLFCAGHSISNAHYGIYASKGTFNDTVSGCTVRNNTYGVYLGNMVKFSASGIKASGNHYGLYVFADDDGNITNVTATKNYVGTYVNGTTYVTLSGFHLSNNTYGAFLDNSTDVYLNGGSATLNSKTDLYCTANTYNSTLLSIQNSQCGSSDCGWAPNCPVRSLPALATYPVTGCATIDVPGSYQLAGPVLYQKSGTCFNIKASNVDFTCNNNTVLATNGGGTGFDISNVSNVTVSDCRVSAFANGFVAVNDVGVQITNSTSYKSTGGFEVNGSSGTQLSGDFADEFASYGFLLYRTNDSLLRSNHATSHSAGNGYWLEGAFHNKVTNNTANYTGNGLYFNNSRQNDIYNNSVQSSGGYDYYCNMNSGGVLGQYGRINYGVTKRDCTWLVELPFASTQNICSYRTSADTITLSQDMFYPYGSSCFTLYSIVNSSADGSTIDCAGHTIYATHGGTFMSAHNVSATIKNCVLVGFSNPIIFNSSKSASGITVMNNTIVNNNGTGISVNHALLSQILYNNITNSTAGIFVNAFNSSKIGYNRLSGMSNGIYATGSLSITVMNNTVSNTSNGISIENSAEVTSSGNKVS